MSKFSQKRYKNVGELSSKYAYDKNGEKFEADIQSHIDKWDEDYNALKEFAKSRGILPDKLRHLLRELILEYDL